MATRPQLHARLHWIYLAAAIMLGPVTACFSDLEATPDSETCAAGTVGCVCASGACEIGLVCAAGANLCVPANDADASSGTTRGQTSLSATTVAGVTTGASASEVSTTHASVGATTAPSTTAPSTTDASVGAPTDGDPPDSTSSTSDTDPPRDCVELSLEQLDCMVCFACVEEDEQDCAAEAERCDATPGCREVEGCLSLCEAQGLCFNDCCVGHPAPVVEAARALSQCHRDNCISEFCAGFTSPRCSEGP